MNLKIAKGIKISCSHFQFAAWAFQQVRDIYSVHDLADDCAPNIMTFKMNVMLAQAQECVLEKSIIDARKPSINAKVSAQCVDYYKLALVNLENPNTLSLMGSRKIKVSPFLQLAVSPNLLQTTCFHRSSSSTSSSSATCTAA